MIDSTSAQDSHCLSCDASCSAVINFSVAYCHHQRLNYSDLIEFSSGLISLTIGISSPGAIASHEMPSTVSDEQLLNYKVVGDYTTVFSSDKSKL